MTDGYPIFHCIHDVDLPRDNRGHRRYAKVDSIASLIEEHSGVVLIMVEAYAIHERKGPNTITAHLFDTPYINLDKATFEEFFIPQREFNKRFLNSLLIRD
jgi:hypothetical protein